MIQISDEQIDAFCDIADNSAFTIKKIEPAEWNERYRTLSRQVTPFPGKFSYHRTPYLKEVVNRFSPHDPAKKVAVMKGAQIGFSTGVVEAGTGYLIDVNPCNILLLTGHENLAQEQMTDKIDEMIDSTGLRKLIKPNSATTKRTGDTSTQKEFPGGVLRAGYAGNHKLLRQRSVQVIIVDDFDAAKSFTKESGDTTEMISFRQAAYYRKMKLFMISTPELKSLSNIEPAFLAGDQRYFFMPCPVCNDWITFEWELTVEGYEKAGIVYELDEGKNLIPESVGYKCQKCLNFFDESHKQKMLEAGKWFPTAEPSEPGYVSYHLNSLYAPPGMFDWTRYARQYLAAYPPGGEKNEQKAQTFQNLVLGKTYEFEGEEPRSSDLQKNLRNYPVGEVPESLSQKDGNGSIILLTCAADLNGKVDDARVDYEIIGWSETGASYSIDAGSIGTFIPREYERKEKVDRERWSYDLHKENSVWPEFENLVSQKFMTDTGRKMPVFVSGIDAPGHFANQAYAFLDRTTYNIIALKGKEPDKFMMPEKDVSSFQKGKERKDLYLVEVNKIKDDLANKMRSEWDPDKDSTQPPGFMNFPTPQPGKNKYTYKDYFSHFESEKREIKQKQDGSGVTMRWVKKNSSVQNHFWDVAVYNIALRDIVVYWAFSSMKIKHYGWADFARLVKNN